MKEIQVWAVGMKICYNWDYMPQSKSNEAELKLFLSTNETSSTGWHLVTSKFTAADKPGYAAFIYRVTSLGNSAWC